jgi:hypothetical protein
MGVVGNSQNVMALPILCVDAIMFGDNSAALPDLRFRLVVAAADDDGSISLISRLVRSNLTSFSRCG